MFITTYSLQNCQTKINIPPTPIHTKHRTRTSILSVDTSQYKHLHNEIPKTTQDSDYESDDIGDTLSHEERPIGISQRFKKYPRARSAQGKNMNFNGMERAAWNQNNPLSKPQKKRPPPTIITSRQANIMSRVRRTKNDKSDDEILPATIRAMKTLRMSLPKSVHETSDDEEVPETLNYEESPELVPETPNNVEVPESVIESPRYEEEEVPESVTETTDDEVPGTPPDDLPKKISQTTDDQLYIDGTDIKVLYDGGGGGSVFKYNDYAIKIFTTKVNTKRIEREFKIAYKLQISEFIGKTYRAQTLFNNLKGFHNLAMVMDYYPGTLMDLHMLKPNQAKYYIRECVYAIQFMHSKGIVHRDLKASNICLSADGHIKVIDFGVAIDLNDETKENMIERSAPFGTEIPPRFTETTHFMQHLYKGNKAVTGEDARYVNNEELMAFDMFSLASIIYYINKKKEPEYEYKITWYGVAESEWNKIAQSLVNSILDEDLKELLLNLWTYSENNRWTAEDVLNSKWIKSGRYYDRSNPPVKYERGKWIDQWEI
jgi:hypothetical protein